MKKPLLLRIEAKKEASVDKAFKEVHNFATGTSKDVKAAAQAFREFAQQTSTASKGASDLATRAQKATSQASTLGKATGQAAGAFKEMESATGSGARGLDKVSTSAKNVGDDLKKVKKEAEDAEKSLKGLGDAPALPRSRDKGRSLPQGSAPVPSSDPSSGGGLNYGNLVQSAAIGKAVEATFSTALGNAVNFEAELRNLNTITEMSDEALKNYGDNLRTLSLELKTTTGAAENARAAYDVASAGFVDASSNAKVLEATLKAATAGGVDAAAAAKLISGSLRAYGAGAQEAEKFTNVFFTTVKKGITTFPELSSSLGSVTGIAAQAGVSIEELGAAVATATSRGIRTTQAVDGLRGAITNLLAPSEQAKKEMERLGIVVNEQTLKQKGLLGTLQEIAQANGGSAESFKLLLGDVQAFSTALTLTSDGGRLFAENLKEMQTNVTALSDAVEEKSKSMQASFDQFKVSLEAASGAAGETFLPAGKLLLDTATSILSAFTQLPEPVRDFVSVLGALAIATGASVKVVKLLATATQLETIQLAINTAAKGLNTTVTDANTLAAVKNTFARGKAAVSMAGASLSTNALSVSMTGLATSLKASAAATGLVGGAFAVLVGAVAAGGIALYKYTELQKEHNVIAEKQLEIELRMAKGQRDYAKLLKLTTKEMKEQKVAAIDLTDAILANLERQEAAKAAGNTKLLNQLQEENKKLRRDRKEIATDEATDRTQKRNEAKNAASRPGLDEQKEADRKQEEARKEILAEELSRIEVLKNRRELSADEEIASLDRVLEKFKVNADERRQIEERVARLIGEKRAKAEKDAEEATKKRLEDSLKSGTAIPADITKNQKGTQEAVDAYQSAIEKVEEWLRKNKALLDQFPELGQKAESALEKLKADKAAAETDRLTTNFKNLQNELKQTELKATTAAEKLEAIDDQVVKLKQEQRAGNISLQDSEQELARLARERLATEQTITMQKLRQAGEINELEQEGVRQEIEMLERLKEQGVDVTGELLLKREELYNLRVKRLEDEYQAELKTAADKLHVEQKYQLERRNLERDHTLELSKEMKKRLDEAVTTQKKLNNVSSTRSGQDSPDPSSSNSGKAQLRLGEISSNPNFFSVEASSFQFQTEEDKEAKRARQAEEAAERRRLFEQENPQAVLEVQRIEQERARERARREAERDPRRLDSAALFGEPKLPIPPESDPLKAMDPSGVLKQGQAALNEQAANATGPTTVNNNTTNTVIVNTESRKTRNVASAEDAVKEVEKAITTAQFYDPKAGIS